MIQWKEPIKLFVFMCKLGYLRNKDIFFENNTKRTLTQGNSKGWKS